MASGIHPIHTLDARGNIFLEVVRDHFGVSPDGMLTEIQRMRGVLVDALRNKGINYDELRSALVPDRQKKEIALVFDTSTIRDGWYGNTIFNQIIPLMDIRSNHSVLFGDYTGSAANEDALYKEFARAIVPVRDINYKHSSQFCIVYINNISDFAINKFLDGLKNFVPFCGYVDTTFHSQFKTMLSLMIVNLFVKYGRYIIQGHEDDVSNDENYNMCGYSFEENQHTCVSVQSHLYGVFLSYKIETAVFDGFEADREFSINAVNSVVLDIDQFEIAVEDAKLEYLKRQKSGSLEAAGLENTTRSELEAIIKRKVRSNYIYNMAFNSEYKTTKFNIIIEIENKNQEKFRLLGSFEYIPTARTLRLITLF